MTGATRPGQGCIITANGDGPGRSPGERGPDHRQGGSPNATARVSSTSPGSPVGAPDVLSGSATDARADAAGAAAHGHRRPTASWPTPPCGHACIAAGMCSGSTPRPSGSSSALRAARREDFGIEGDLRTFIARHMVRVPPVLPGRGARRRIGTPGSGDRRVSSPGSRRRCRQGTLVLRTEIGGGPDGAGATASSRRVSATSSSGLAVGAASSSPRPATASMPPVPPTWYRATARVPVEIEELPTGHRPSGWRSRRACSGGSPAGSSSDGTRSSPWATTPFLEAATFAAAVWAARRAPRRGPGHHARWLIDTGSGARAASTMPGVGRNLLGAIHQPAATILDVALVDESRRWTVGRRWRRRSSTA